MQDLSLLIISNNPDYAEAIENSLSGFSRFSIKHISFSEASEVIRTCHFNIIILDENLEYDSDFIILLKNIEFDTFFIGLVDDSNENLFSKINSINLFGYIETPIKAGDIKEIFHSLISAEAKRDELKKAGLYDYLTQPISRENVDNVISIVYDYMTKPITKDGVEKAASNIYEYITTPITKTDIEHMIKKVIRNVNDYRANTDKDFSFLLSNDDLVGKSKHLFEIKELVKKVAPTDTTVLILGESGTGKELIANSIYKTSLRRDRNYITINCAAISPNLIESELFGYEKGAFTGALSSRKGIIEEADNGTLFLDEIGDMDIHSQAKLLRVIENGEMRRVGGTKTIHVDVRFIAATNQNLEEYVESGHFRRDLYYRLMSFPIPIKPLRERKDDIEILTHFFIYKATTANKKLKKNITKEAIDILQKYNYPGNIRELKNIIDRAIIMSDEYIKPENLPLELRDIKSTYSDDKSFFSLHELLKNNILNIEEFEKALIVTALDKTGWNRNEAIKLLGIGRTTLYEKMKKYNFEDPKR